MKKQKSASPSRKKKSENPPTRKSQGVKQSEVDKLLEQLLRAKMPLNLLAGITRRTKFSSEADEAQDVTELSGQITALAEAHAKRIGEFSADLAMVAEKYGSPADRGAEATAAWNQLRDACDQALARIARELPPWVQHRSAKTESVELLMEMTSCIHAPERLAHAIDRCIDLLPEEAQTGDSTPSYYADYVWWLVYHLTELCSRFPEGVRGTAETYPCWPTLQFRHKAGNTEFGELADGIHLGRASVIDATEVARYHWRTPLNRYLLFKLWRVDGVLNSLKNRPGISIEEALAYRLKEASGSERIGEAELPFFQRAQTLSPLTKKNAKMWAGEVIAPLIFVLEADFSKVPELREAIAHANYNTRACHRAVLKTAIRRGLTSMAPP